MLTFDQNVLFLRQLHQSHVLPLVRHLRPELFPHLLQSLPICLCRLAQDRNPMTRCPCITLSLMLALQLQRRPWQLEAVHLQCLCCVMRRHPLRHHKRREHPILEARIARRMQHLPTGDPARFLQSLVACLSSRPGHHRRHHHKSLLLQAARALTCNESPPQTMMSAAKAITRVTTTPTLHLV